MAVALSQSSFILNSWGMEVLGLPASSFPRRELAKRTALKARKVIVDAGILRDIWIKIGVPSRKIEVIPFGVDINMFNPSVNGGNVRRNLGIRKDDFAIISTRPFYNSHYNIECLIESIPTVVVRHSNARFIIKGSGPREQYLRRLVERLGVSKYVRFVGIVPHFEVARYLRAADIYVSTSFIDSTSVSLLEAMACGVAPVVTNIPGNREWIRDEVNGLLYPPRDPMALAGRISRLIENEDQRREFGERCSMIIERKANWKECVRKVEAIYEELLQ
jgi:glycosyltransferase involved in cell wall biosynthesis